MPYNLPAAPGATKMWPIFAIVNKMRKKVHKESTKESGLISFQVNERVEPPKRRPVLFIPLAPCPFLWSGTVKEARRGDELYCSGTTSSSRFLYTISSPS
jgi:hypothetical protein